jgi:hypothetical protein
MSDLTLLPEMGGVETVPPVGQQHQQQRREPHEDEMIDLLHLIARLDKSMALFSLFFFYSYPSSFVISATC